MADGVEFVVPQADVMPQNGVPSIEMPEVQLPKRSDGSLDSRNVDPADREQRNQLVGQLGELARGLSPSQIVNELLPLLRECICYDDAVTQVANALDDIGKALRPERCPIRELSGLLRDLFTHVDAHVGSAATKAALDFVHDTTVTVADQEQFVDTVCTMATRAADYGVAGKVNAAALLPAAFSIALRIDKLPKDAPPSPSEKTDQGRTGAAAAGRVTRAAPSARAGPPKMGTAAKTVRKLYQSLVGDSSSAVRRAAAASIHMWLTNDSTQDTVYHVKLWVDALMKDSLQDSVRYTTLPHLVHLARLSTEPDTQLTLCKLIAQAASDASWRVRWCAAKHIVDVMKLMPPPRAGELWEAVVKLAEDPENEVRACVALRIGEVAERLDPQNVARVVSTAIGFCEDANLSVRAAAARSICDVVRNATEEQVSRVKAVVKALLRDDADVVKLNVLRALPSLRGRLRDEAFMAELNDQLTEISDVRVSRWRVRERVAEELRHLAVYIPIESSVTVEMLSCRLVNDPVAAVRTTALATLPPIASHYGPAWSQQQVKRFGLLHAAESFRDRQLYVQVLEAMLPYAVNPSTGRAKRRSGNSPPRSGSSDPTAAASPPASTENSGAFDSPQHPPVDAGVAEAFWRNIGKHIRILAQDPVNNVRLALCRFLFRPTAARIRPVLGEAFDAARGLLFQDANDEVRAAAASFMGGTAAAPAAPY